MGAISHILLVIPAIPSVIASGHALGRFILAILILAFASGLIKPSLSPLLCDQSPVKKRSSGSRASVRGVTERPRTETVITLKSGENVILDPATTVSRYMLIFYWVCSL